MGDDVVVEEGNLGIFGGSMVAIWLRWLSLVAGVAAVAMSSARTIFAAWPRSNAPYTGYHSLL